MAKAIRIGLLDGDASIRAGRRLIIDSQPDLQVVYEEQSALEALDRLPQLLVDVLVIDHRLAGLDGIEFAQQLVDLLCQSDLDLPKIVITGPYFSPELQLASIRAGASDLVTMEQGGERLLTAIRNAVALPSEPDFGLLVQSLSDSTTTHLGSQLFLMRLGELTAKERAVLDLFAALTPYEEICVRLGMQMHRVRKIFDNILRRCRFATRSQLFLALAESRRASEVAID